MVKVEGRCAKQRENASLSRNHHSETVAPRCFRDTSESVTAQPAALLLQSNTTTTQPVDVCWSQAPFCSEMHCRTRPLTHTDRRVTVRL